MNIKFAKYRKSDKRNIKTLYLKAFPKEERLPIWFLALKAKAESVNFYSLYDDDRWVGFIYFALKNDLLYVLFFAIDEASRSQGYGGSVISELKEMFPTHKIVLNTEVLDENAPNNSDRIRRRRFYEKHGFKETGYRVKLTNTLSFDYMLHGDSFCVEEFFDLVKWYLGKVLWVLFRGEKVYKQTVGNVK